MRKTLLLCTLALAVLALPSVAQAHVEITGPSRVDVPYNSCVTATWTASPTHYDSYSWTFDGNSAGSGTSYSRTFCNPNLPEFTVANHTVGLSATNNGVTETDSVLVYVTYYGSCSPQIFC